MNRTTMWSAGVLLAGVAFWLVCGNGWAQTWRQDAWQDAPAPAQSTSAPTDWQQRVLKQPQPQKQVDSDRWVSPRQTVEQTPSDYYGQGTASMRPEPFVRGKTRAKWVSGQEVIPPGTPQPDAPPLAAMP